MVPKLMEAVEHSRLTNNSIRPTTIRSMKRSGIEDRAIMTVTGHRCPQTLDNYDPEPTLEKKLDMANAISTWDTSINVSNVSIS